MYHITLQYSRRKHLFYIGRSIYILIFIKSMDFSFLQRKLNLLCPQSNLVSSYCYLPDINFIPNISTHSLYSFKFSSSILFGSKIFNKILNYTLPKNFSYKIIQSLSSKLLVVYICKTTVLLP